MGNSMFHQLFQKLIYWYYYKGQGFYTWNLDEILSLVATMFRFFRMHFSSFFAERRKRMQLNLQWIRQKQQVLKMGTTRDCDHLYGDYYKYVVHLNWYILHVYFLNLHLKNIFLCPDKGFEYIQFTI